MHIVQLSYIWLVLSLYELRVKAGDYLLWYNLCALVIRGAFMVTLILLWLLLCKKILHYIFDIPIIAYYL